MYTTIAGRTTDGKTIEVAVGADGKLQTDASVSLPAGAATAAKQDEQSVLLAAISDQLPVALGAGGGLKVDGSGTALPVSAASLPLPTGAATAAAQTDGSQKAIPRGGAKGATTAADVTSTNVSADRQGLDVVEQLAPAYEDGTNGVAAGQWKPLAVSTYTPSLYANRGAAASANIKATPGNVFSVTCLNTNAAVRYLQLHNKASAAANPEVPLLEFPVPASGGFIVIGQDFFTAAGIHFSTGITFGVSTTRGTYTAATAGEHDTQVTYK
jgi:hypothetical protein